MDPDSMMMMQPPPTTRLSIHSSHPAAAAAAARKCPGNVSVSADRWNQKLEQLREYAAEHDGCCDVPQKHPELGIWVNKVRVGCPSQCE
jgi:hypothetical protein